MTLKDLEKGQAIHDSQIKSMRSLLDEGIRLAIEWRKEMKILQASQKRTDAQLQSLIESLEHAGNVHSKKRLDPDVN